MFYCTIYRSHNRVNAKNKTFELALCLAYSSAADAEKMKNHLLQQAKEANISVIEALGAYRTIYGDVYLTIGGFMPSRQYGNNIYSIGVENTETLFSRLPDETRKSINLSAAVKDGYKYEKITQDYLQRQQDYRKVEQDKINSNLTRFETEIKDITELDQILRVLLKYAGQKINKEKLIAIAVRKIQGEAQPEKTNDWFDELSDINN